MCKPNAVAAIQSLRAQGVNPQFRYADDVAPAKLAG